MRPLRSLLVLAAILASALPTMAGEAQRVDAEGAWAAFTVPEGEWQRFPGARVEGQWGVTFMNADGVTALDARVFPVQDDADPEAVIHRALDMLATRAGAEGLGVAERRGHQVGGRPAADAAFTMTFGTARRTGRARLLLASGRTWVFAWGYTDPARGAAAQELVQRFVESLEPTAPRFHEPRFAPAGLDEPCEEGEAALTRAHLVAATRLVEAALGKDLPLRLRLALDRALLEAAASDAALRERLRTALDDVRAAASLPPTNRRGSLRLHGDALRDALVAEGSPAKEALERLAADATGAPSRFGLLALAEWGEFLASLARDEETTLPEEEREALLASTAARFESLPPAERRVFDAFSVVWASVRRAWDAAGDEARFRFRREALAILSPAVDRAAVRALPDARALAERLAIAKGREPRALVGAALALDAESRSALLALLADPGEGDPLGW
jgi:hypothetical protein